jgi:hypothetical protein
MSPANSDWNAGPTRSLIAYYTYPFPHAALLDAHCPRFHKTRYKLGKTLLGGTTGSSRRLYCVGKQLERKLPSLVMY